MPNQRLKYLFDQYVQGNCTPDEKRELSALALAKRNDEDVQQLLDDYWEKVSAEKTMPDGKSEDIVKSILGNEIKVIPRVHRIHFRKARWWAAAAIFILFATGGYFLFFNNKGNKQDRIANGQPAKDIKAPETNRAMITLVDGRTVYLDGADNGQLAVQGNVKLVKLSNGQIAYETTTGEVLTELKYNTLNNPRGSKVIDMALADGSHVWLNAGSSITYPIAFVGNDRNVTITGEAYFEIAHDQLKPFKVSKGETTIEVLGTHFNVNAYEDEDDIKVTLLEGSVKVTSDQQSLTIQPNQQAVVAAGNVLLNTKVDVEEVMAWKNGRFEFTGNDVESVMRQVSRWYDVQIVYEGIKPVANFRGGIGRTENVSQVLKMLELTETVKFKIEDKKVIVTRWKQ